MSSEILTGCSSGEKAPLTLFAGEAEPGDDRFNGAELVRDWSDGVEFVWLYDAKMDDTGSDVFELFMDCVTAIEAVGELLEDAEVSDDW